MGRLSTLQVTVNEIHAPSSSSQFVALQGDALSSILFAIYFKEAVSYLYSSGRVRLNADTLESLVFADDTEVFSFLREYLDKLTTVLGPLVREDSMLIVNVDKTENSLVGHSDMGTD